MTCKNQTFAVGKETWVKSKGSTRPLKVAAVAMKKDRKKKAAGVRVVAAAPAPAAPANATGNWQYKANDDQWRDYDPAASDVVEKVYQGYLGNRGDTDVRAVKSGQWEYMVDFQAFKQTNIKHENHRVRDIRRVLRA